MITFTTLGYGHIFPIGIGKIIASLEVVSGLLLVALFVGKIASERQSTLLLLLYTSENQRRLKEFAADVDELTDTISDKLNDYDHQGI